MKKVLAAGGLVLNQHSELLMIFRRSKWDLPKGHVEKNETFEACALREVREETGLNEIKLIRFIGVTEHEYYDSGLESEAIKEVHWFAMAANKEDQLQPQVAESIEWIRWVPKNKLENYLNNSYENIRYIISRIEWENEKI